MGERDTMDRCAEKLPGWCVWNMAITEKDGSERAGNTSSFVAVLRVWIV